MPEMPMMTRLADLTGRSRGAPPQRIAIAAAADDDVLLAACQAEAASIATCFYIGDKDAIRAKADGLGVALDAARIVDQPDTHQAARLAVAMVRTGEADLPMKGLLHTADFLRAALDRDHGLRAGGLLSLVSVCDKIGQDGLLCVTDCGINITPSLDDKALILDNAVALACRLGNPRPKVAVLAAVEVINPAMPETLDAQALKRMAEAGRFAPAIVDGPFALDNAVSVEAARHKGIGGPVAGRADVILVPDIRVGNVLHKSLAHFAERPLASVVVGATVPLVVTSRADTATSRFLSVALAAYLTASA